MKMNRSLNNIIKNLKSWFTLFIFLSLGGLLSVGIANLIDRLLKQQNNIEGMISIFSIPLIMGAFLSNKEHKNVAKLMLLSSIFLFGGFFLTNVELIRSSTGEIVSSPIVKFGYFIVILGSFSFGLSVTNLLYQLMKAK